MPQFDSQFFSSLIFWEIVSFGILLWVLYRFALPPILKILEIREQKIRDTIEQADQNRHAAEQRLKEYEAKLSGAVAEAQEIVEDARKKAQRELEENQQRLRADSERIKTQATQEIDRERRKAVQEVRNQVADLAILVAEKVILRSLSQEDHKRLAQEALQAVGDQQQNGDKEK